MSSFKEIVFVVQQSHTQSSGFERVAMELSKALSQHYSCKLKTIPAPSPTSTSKLYNSFTRFLYSCKYLLLCLKYASQGDILYFFGKKSALCFPLIHLLSNKRIFSQIQILPYRLSGKRGISRLWERLEERLALNFADKVFVDSPKAQSYLKEEYNRSASITYYGADHTCEQLENTRPGLLAPSRKYAIAYMPVSPQQALMALKSFAQYPKYDYYLILEESLDSLEEEILKFKAYDHIHFVEKNSCTVGLFSNAYIYFHLEPSVEARIRLLEAMKAGKFTLSFDTVFSRNLTRDEALYFSNHSQLISCLQRAVTQSHFDQGDRMKTLADKLSWRTVAENIHQHIEESHPQGLVSLVLNRSK